MGIGLPNPSSSVDRSSRRDFHELAIHERVLDTGDRTINIDNIATISVETRRYRWWRWLAWLIGAAIGLKAGLGLVDALQYWRVPGVLLAALGSVMLYGLLAAACIGFGVWLRDVMYLQIGASDGSRTIFKSRDKAYLLEVKTFLLRKINDRNTAATNHFYFGDQIAGDKVDGDKVAGDKTHTQTTTTVRGSGHQVIAGSPQAAIHAGANLQQAYGAPGAQFGTGHAATGNSVQITRIDYSSVLPDIEQLQRFYAEQPQAEYLEQRLAELGALMRTGTPTPQQRGRVRDLAVDLASLLQAYPAMMQFFQHVAHMVGV